ncbi:MAG: hypothetical protein J6Z04_06160 [Clostridia bacterium]|nr:hypothetical protein [Clostridia bacterium]
MNTVPANSISQNVSNVNSSGEKSSLSPSPVTRETDIRYSPMSASERVVLRARKPKESIVKKFKNGEINRTAFRKAIDNMIESAKILTVNAQQAVENQLIRGGMSKRQAGAYTQFARSARSHAFNAVSIALSDMNGDVRARGLLPILEPFLFS